MERDKQEKKMIKTLEHVGFLTNDLQKSVEFYTDVLGFSISTTMNMNEVGLTIIFVEKDGNKIELMGYGNVPKRSENIQITMGDKSIPLNDHITFSVDDIQDTVAELKKKKVIFDMDPIELESGLKLASFKDPNGVLIELVEHPAGIQDRW